MGEVYKIETYEPEAREPEMVVVDTEPEHVRYLSMNLRECDLRISEKVGIPAHKALWRVYKKALVCRTVFVNGIVVAVFGISGTFLGKTGHPWLIASPYVEDYPMKFAFRYRTELRNMLNYFPILVDYVNLDDDKTIRLLGILGFTFEKQPKTVNGVTFVKATLVK